MFRNKNGVVVFINEEEPIAARNKILKRNKPSMNDYYRWEQARTTEHKNITFPELLPTKASVGNVKNDL